ncbi:hypothetical protein [Nocardioides sp.]|uniref:hypothetical protein n=1 Tax=Nocardioides sp. TaxID=35761 RepID=UPI003D149B83
MSRRIQVAPIGVLAATALAYLRWIRPWQLTWGATAAEAVRALPGDDLVPRPSFAATRAISIQAPPERVWPWLVQVGMNRAGWYSYDLIDNLGRPSAVTILPQFQDLAVGDTVPMSPSGRVSFPVLAMSAPYSMVWGTADDLTWTWQLDREPDGSTRLLSRMRCRYRWTSPMILVHLGLEFGDIVMMRRMLLNLRGRAEA